MGTSVSFCTEHFEVIGLTVDDTQMILSRLIRRGAASGTRLLQYVDTYGTTVFNYLQTPDLARDLTTLLNAAELTPAESAHLRRIAELVGAPNPERFLVLFSGD